MKITLVFTFILGLIAALFPFTPVWGIDFSDAVFPEFATSARALALGNAYVARVDDSASAFYNPAGLGTVRGPTLHLSNLHLEVNKDFANLGADGSALDAPGNFLDGFDVDGTRQLLQGNPGSFSHSRFHLTPNFTTRFFSIGYLYSTQTRGAFGTQAGAQFEYARRVDHGPFVSMNISTFGGIFKFGATTTFLNRREVFGSGDINTTINLQDADYNKGHAFIFTTGAKLTLPVYALPTFAVKINNTGRTAFSASDGSAGAPNTIEDSIDLGFSLSPNLSKTTRLHFEVNYKDLNGDYDNVTSARRLGAGLELDFARTFFLRLGYGDGFGSGGLGIKTRKFEFDLTTYAVDRTNSQFRGDEDRRFILSFSSGY